MTRDRGTRAVFVAGLGHSGSTLLDLMLAGHGQMIGLGEVQSLLRLHARDRDTFLSTPCSCGRDLAACPFWRTVAERLAREKDASVPAGYRCVVGAFAAAFGTDVALVDSSKNLDALRFLRATGADVSVLYLIRDVRGWAVSMRDRNHDRGHHTLGELVRGDGLRGLARLAGQTAEAYFRFWHRRNRGLQQGIVELGVPALRLGYEPLATSTVPTMEAVAGWLGLPFEAGLLAPNPDGSHTAWGNDMRLSPEKLRAVLYDTRWLNRRDWMLPAAFHAEIMRYNAEQVYESPTPLA